MAAAGTRSEPGRRRQTSPTRSEARPGRGPVGELGPTSPQPIRPPPDSPRARPAGRIRAGQPGSGRDDAVGLQAHAVDRRHRHPAQELEVDPGHPEPDQCPRGERAVTPHDHGPGPGPGQLGERGHRPGGDVGEALRAGAGVVRIGPALREQAGEVRPRTDARVPLPQVVAGFDGQPEHVGQRSHRLDCPQVRAGQHPYRRQLGEALGEGGRLGVAASGQAAVKVVGSAKGRKIRAGVADEDEHRVSPGTR